MKLRYGVGATALLAALLAACSGGSGSGGYTPAPPPSAPQSVSASAPLSTSKTTSVQLSAIANGSSATVTLPAASGTANASVTLQDWLPSGSSSPQLRHVASIGASSITPLDYLLVSVDTTVSIASTPGFTFTLPSAPASSSLYIAELDLGNAAAGWNVVLGPGTVSGDTISFAAQPIAPPLTLKANDTYVFALVATGAAVTPAPPTIPSSTSASYTGSKTVNYSYGYDFDYPNPAPSATAPPVTLSYNISANVSVGASPYPGTSSATLIDEHTAETDSANTASSSYTTDSWIALTASGSSYNELLYGQTLQEPSSANLPVITTLYNNPQTIDQLPESAGASWTNSPQSSVAYSYASGDSGTRTVASDGTYTDTEQLGPVSGGSTATLTENADGSGSITGPYFGGGIIDSVQFSAPSPAPSATPAVNVTINFSSFAQTNYGLPAQQVIPDDVWYPYTAGQPLSFYNETDKVTTGVSLPQSCSSAPYGTANDVQRTITSLDTVIGDVDTTTIDSYNVDGFPVCLVTSDVLNFAYDEQGNTPYFIYIGTQLGLETVTTNETLVIQNTPSAQARKAAVQTNPGPIAAALQAHILNALGRERVVHEHAFLKALRNGRSVHHALIQGDVR